MEKVFINCYSFLMNNIFKLLNIDFSQLEVVIFLLDLYQIKLKIGLCGLIFKYFFFLKLSNNIASIYTSKDFCLNLK